MIKAGIIGGAGYTAGELIRLLYQRKDGLRHSSTEAEDVKIQFLIREIWTRG